MITARPVLAVLAAAALVAAAGAAGAAPEGGPPVTSQSPAPGYGQPVSLDRAKRIVAAAEAEARRQGFLMAFAVVEPTGGLVAFERMDGVQYGSIEVSQAKARTAALFRRPSKAFADAVAAGKLGVLGFPGAVAVEGGVPIVVDGHIIGALGVSGGTSEQDGAVAAAALADAK